MAYHFWNQDQKLEIVTNLSYYEAYSINTMKNFNRNMNVNCLYDEYLNEDVWSESKWVNIYQTN
jgi:hypothetical protein